MVTYQFGERLPERFWDRVIPEPNSGCWLWVGPLNRDGYGHYYVRGDATRRAQHRENMRRSPVLMARDGGVAAQRERDITHCPDGHPYAGDNLYVQPRAGGRVCKLCDRAAGKRWRERNRERINARHRERRLRRKDSTS